MKYSIMIKGADGLTEVMESTDAFDNRDAFIKAVSACIGKGVQPSQISVIALPEQHDSKQELTERLDKLEASLSHAVEAAARCERADDARFEQERIRGFRLSIAEVKAKLEALEAGHE